MASPPPAQTPSAPLLDDQPSSVDLLGFGQFAAALQAVILNPQTKTPFIIGIFGRWGTGKTTLMRMLQRELSSAGVTPVWFSAWRYKQEKEIWAAFLQSLSARLTSRLPLRDRLRFAAGVFRRGLAWDRLVYEIPRLVARAAVVAAPVLVAALLAGDTGSRLAARLLQSGGAVGSAVLAVIMFLRPAAAAVRREVRPDFAFYRTVDFESHVGFLDRFRGQLARIVASVPGRAGRVVVFVDDLDRCAPDQALQVLDAIKVFLDVPGLVFVLGLDVAVIQRALAHVYPDDPVAQQEYLSKIVQLPFHLPVLTGADLTRYLHALDVSFPDERCRDVFLASLSRNPRELKRVINTYALHWYLAGARDVGAAVTPLRLAKVIVIQQRFPALFALLRDQPAHLALLERRMRGDTSETHDEDTGPATLVIAPSGVSVPPSLLPFVEEQALVRLLRIHVPDNGAPDDAGFADLSAEEIAPYFTLAHQPAPAGSEVDGEPDARATRGAAPEFPDFGPRYDVIRRIGYGGMSEIYLAQDRSLHRQVAVKRLVSTLVNDPTWVARFRREADLLAGMRPHVNVVALLDAGVSRNDYGHEVPFYTMEYLSAETLEDVLESDGRLSLQRARALLLPVFSALSHIHAAGLVHRDLKPSAILIGPGDTPKLADFGLALRPVEGRDDLTSAGTIIGTPAYMSPEQIQDREVDARSDLFSFGIVILEALTGTNPLAEGSHFDTLKRLVSEDLPAATTLAPDLPDTLDPFFTRILARDPTARFEDADTARQAFIDALDPAGASP